jgi:alpha-tubulin suppressor-like RCC1 family protein
MTDKLSIDLARIIALYYPRYLLRYVNSSTTSDEHLWKLNTKIIFGHDIESKTVKCKDNETWKLLYKYLSENRRIYCNTNYCEVIMDDEIYGCRDDIHEPLTPICRTRKDKFKNIGDILNAADITFGEYGMVIMNINGKLYNCHNEKYDFDEMKDAPVNIVDMKGGYHHAIVKDVNGKLYSFGSNVYGQLGLGDKVNRKEWEEIKLNPSDNITNIACGGWHTIVADKNGQIYGVGDNDGYQLGLKGRGHRDIFEKIKTGIVAKKIYCGHSSTIVVDTDGSIYECGIGTCSKSNKFIKLNINIADIVDISCEISTHMFIRTADGSLYKSKRSIASKSQNVVLFDKIDHPSNDIIVDMSAGSECIMIVDIKGKIWKALLSNHMGKFEEMQIQN